MLSYKTAEDQAKLSVVLAGVSLALALGVWAAILQAFDASRFMVPIGSGGFRLLAILAAGLLATACGGIGFLLGLSSAGQRKNQKVGVSWMGFFLSAGGVTLALCGLVFFWLAKQTVA